MTGSYPSLSSSKAYLEWTTSDISNDLTRRLMADVNGDGLTDALTRALSSDLTHGVYAVFLGTGEQLSGEPAVWEGAGFDYYLPVTAIVGTVHQAGFVD